MGVNTELHRRYRRALSLGAERWRRENDARIRAEMANAEKDRTLSAVCHDLRTPLNAILGWAQLALRSASDPREALSRIEAGARLQSLLINDILDLATSTNGTLRIHRAPVDLNGVVVAAQTLVETVASEKGIALNFEPNPRPAFVLGDALRLQRVIWNLLTNAVKFTPHGGRIEVDLQTDGSTVRLSVCDTGGGISPMLLPRIFGRFERDAGASDRNCSGAGLGLAIVRRLVELHGGRVEAKSRGKGQGATFTVWLPRLERGSDCDEQNNNSSPVDEVALFSQ